MGARDIDTDMGMVLIIELCNHYFIIPFIKIIILFGKDLRIVRDQYMRKIVK